MKRHSL